MKYLILLLLLSGSNFAYTQNIALQKPTSQSSNYYSGNLGNSNKAVDGNTIVNAQDANTYTHTKIENNPWWKLDLGNEFDINKISVYNRTDCCTSRLAGVKIYIGNIDSTDPNDFIFVNVLVDQPFQEFTNINVSGRYILVYSEGVNKILTLAEFEVYGSDSTSNFSNGLWSQSANNINYIGGNVGIGTSNPDSKLAVNGAIHAKEVKVDLVGWPDFVFENNYRLPTLEEVENQIKEKGHLKDMPSAAEVAKNGILLGEMNSKLLQKIEELTLYAIAQEKRLNEQEAHLETLKIQNHELKLVLGRIVALEKKLDITVKNK